MNNIMKEIKSDLAALKNRIKKVVNDNHTTLGKLAGKDSKLQVKLSRQINLSAAVSYDVIAFIIKTFPNINPTWLITGDGEMLNTPQQIEIKYTGDDILFSDESQDMNSLRRRIETLLRTKGKTLNSCAEKDVNMQGKLSRQINRGSAITYDVLLCIIKNCPDVNLDWLILGDGQMIKNINKTTTSSTNFESSLLSEDTKTIIDTLNRQNEIIEYLLSCLKKGK